MAKALGIWLMIDGILSLIIFRQQKWFYQAIRVLRAILGAVLFWQSNMSCQTCIHRKVCKFLHTEMKEKFSEISKADFVKELQRLYKELATKCGYFQSGEPRGH